MKQIILVLVGFLVQMNYLLAQNVMTSELLWQLGKVSSIGIAKDEKSIIYQVKTYDAVTNEASSKQYQVSVDGGKPTEIIDGASLVNDRHISPDGNHRISIQEVKLEKVFGKDYYPELDKSDVMIYDDLMYRYWDTWENGKFNHVFLYKGNEARGIDIMEGEPFNCPQMPFGGEGDYAWSPNGNKVVYVAKKKSGKEYALSTNTDLYSYDIAAGKTANLTEGMMGYDTNPLYAPDGALAWLSMKRDGYESDKNDIIVRKNGNQQNLTQHWDGTVNSFVWKKDGSGLYFNAATDGTIQLFEVDYPRNTKKMPRVKQITNGDFDINGLVGLAGEKMIVSRTDMNHAAELYAVNLNDGSMNQITHVNDDKYKQMTLSKVERRYITTTDKKKMLVWVIYPPRFDSSKKYPTLLYCQGGPQSALSQFYSFRWNFQLMAANGYIVVAPNRRGMPGHGVDWNEAISKDYGGQAMQDYLSAIDEVAKESYVDKDRLGAVGASFGGYSIYYLAGIHENRFNTFISHDGIFNMKSMYGTTEELFFVNWDNGGAYWETKNKAAQKTSTQ